MLLKMVIVELLENSALQKYEHYTAAQNKFSRVTSHSGNLGKFAPRENNPLYGSWFTFTVQLS